MKKSEAELIFDICKQNFSKWVYGEAWVKIIKNNSGDWLIDDVDWVISKLDYYYEDELVQELKNITPESKEIEKEGYYVLKSLFTTYIDSDDYRQWSYLEPIITEYSFQISIEDYEKELSENLDNSDNFNIFDI